MFVKIGRFIELVYYPQDTRIPQMSFYTPLRAALNLRPRNFPRKKLRFFGFRYSMSTPYTVQSVSVNNC